LPVDDHDVTRAMTGQPAADAEAALSRLRRRSGPVPPGLVAGAGRENDRPDLRHREGGPVTDPAENSSGDYGYDMAHADIAHRKTGERAPDDRMRPDAGRRVPPGDTADQEQDQEQDYGYDEAHDF
jgi:hypothetical protein